MLKTHKQKKTKKRNEIKQKIRQDQKSFIWMAPKVLDYPPTNFSDASPAVACGRTHMQLSGKLVPQWDPRGTLEKAKKWNLGP